MRAITIQQPYANLIAIGESRVENRYWATLHRGPLAVHAGKGSEYLLPSDRQRYPDMAWGAIVAVAELVECVSLHLIPNLIGRHRRLQWLRGHEHVEGPICWVLENVERLHTPVPCRGQRLLWTLPSDVAATVAASPRDGVERSST